MADLSNLASFIFNGQPPPQVTTYGSSTTGVPDWLAQGEIGLLNTSAGVAQGLSNAGYPLAGLPQIGAFNPNYNAASGNINSAQENASGYIGNASTANTQVMNGGNMNLAAAQPYYGSASQGFNYALNAGNVNLQAAQPYFDQAQGGFQSGLGANSLGMVSPFAQQAAGMSGVNAASPYLQSGSGFATSAGQQNYLPLAQSYINQGIASSPLGAAAPYLQRATAPLSSTANDLINGSYTQNVNDALATQSARNLQKYLLPASDSQFIGAGQAGSSRNQDYDALTTAYANQDLLSQQSQNLSNAYNAALGTAAQQQGTMAGLAGTAGGLGAAQQQALIGAGTNLANIGYQGAQTQLGAAGQLGALGSTFGNLTSAQQQALLNSGALLGSTNTSDTAQKLQAAQGLSAMGMNAGQLTNSGVGNYLQAAQGLQNLGTSAGSLTNSGVQNYLQAGAQQAGLGQQTFNNAMSTGQAQDLLGQEKQGYDTSAVQANNQNLLNTTNWTPSQLSWLSNILHGLPATGQTVNTTNQGPASVYSPSPASQIGGLALLSKYT